MKVKAKRTMGTDENFIGPFSSLLFLLLCPLPPPFLLFSALLQDGWGIDTRTQLAVLLYRGNMATFC